MFHLRCSAGLVLVAGVLGGCKSDRPSAEVANPAKELKSDSATVAVTASDFGFAAPAKIPAGVNTIHLVNRGTELHQAQLVRLEDGKTADDFVKALKSAGPPPSWVKFVGGPNGIAPGQETHATSVLAPGRYLYVCFIPSADGVMHAAKGMIRPFEVTGASNSSAGKLPPPDVTIRLSDYDFQSSKPLTPGRHTILVQNTGPQPHEVVLLKLAPGMKVEDFAIWAESGMKGLPPAQPLGGVSFLDKGAEGSFVAELTAGDYGLICFVPDTKDGRPHLAHGMMKTIKVS